MQSQHRTRQTKNIKEVRHSFHLAIEPKKTLVLAHCLELDIMASGQDEAQAIKKLGELVLAHLTYTIEHNLPIKSLAPPEQWAKIQNGKGVILDVILRYTESDAHPIQPFYKHEALELCLAT